MVPKGILYLISSLHGLYQCVVMFAPFKGSEKKEDNIGRNPFDILFFPSGIHLVLTRSWHTHMSAFRF
uniref:Uncharacterized protein n=1 Tax=Anguilla anguilla TaxID=7936 RepID=A0A0E9WQC1_ANGAN